LKLLGVFLRNELLLKPKGRRASRAVLAFLRQHGLAFCSVEIWMGLAEPSGLCCLIFFRKDDELASFKKAGHLPTVSAIFREALAGTGYPAQAVPHVDISAHSDETVQREGGYYGYFK
jgi:hypothetical protein